MGIQILAPSHTCLVTLVRTLSQGCHHSFTWEVTYLLWADFPQFKDCHEGSTPKSKCGLRTSSIFLTWKLKMQTFRSHPCPTESKFLTIPSWFVCTWIWEAVSPDSALAARRSARSPMWSGHGWSFVPFYTHRSGNKTVSHACFFQSSW